MTHPSGGASKSAASPLPHLTARQARHAVIARPKTKPSPPLLIRSYTLPQEHCCGVLADRATENDGTDIKNAASARLFDI